VKKYPIEHIMNRLNFVRNQIDAGKEIKNPMGLLQKMMLEPNLFDPIQEEIDKQEIKIQKAKQEQEIKIQKLNKEQQIEQLKVDYEERKTTFMSSCFDQLPNLSKEFLFDFKNKRSQKDVPFIVQLAYDHYTTNIDGIEPASKDEILYNHRLGGSFSALLTEWFDSNFGNEMTEIKKEFEIKYQKLRNSD
jgi:hypothetical protein